MSKVYYLKSHEWVKVDGNKAKIGISDYAQKELGDLVFIGLPEVDDELKRGESFCEVESVKAVSEVNSPVSGTVVAVNQELEDAPELINENALSAWICEVEFDGNVKGLMSEDEYETFIK